MVFPEYLYFSTFCITPHFTSSVSTPSFSFPVFTIIYFVYLRPYLILFFYFHSLTSYAGYIIHEHWHVYLLVRFQYFYCALLLILFAFDVDAQIIIEPNIDPCFTTLLIFIVSVFPSGVFSIISVFLLNLYNICISFAVS